MKTLLSILAFLIISKLIDRSSLFRDDSDLPSPGERSGMVILTDHKTGLQYLKGGLFGTVTPRLNADGTHMREGEP